MTTAPCSSNSTNRGRHGYRADRRKKSTHTDVSTRTSATGTPPVRASECAHVHIQIEVTGRADDGPKLLAAEVVLQGDHERLTPRRGSRNRLYFVEEYLRKIDGGANGG